MEKQNIEEVPKVFDINAAAAIEGIADVDAICAINIAYADFLDGNFIENLGFENPTDMKNHYREKAIKIDLFKRLFDKHLNALFDAMDKELPQDCVKSKLQNLRNLKSLATGMRYLQVAEQVLQSKIIQAESLYEMFYEHD